MAKSSEKKPAKAKTKSGAKAKVKTGVQDAQHVALTGRTGPRKPGVERRKTHPARAHHGHMDVLLTHPVPHLGQAGDLVKVKPGFARNYLLPQGLATFATPHNLRIVEKHRRRLKELEEARRADLLNQAAQIAQKKITIEANANPEGHLYGSVNADQISAALKAAAFKIEPDNVKIEGPLREIGIYKIKVHLGQDVDTEFELWVVPTNPDESAT
jgi:large subunit ribosomal protein L9